MEGLSTKYSGKVAYVTHVPSGSQLVLDRAGRTFDRHDGRGDGPSRLDAVLAEDAKMERIMERLQSDEDARPRESAADWVHSLQFEGITYLAKGSLGGPIITGGERALTIDDLGSELYRVAFRIDGYGGHLNQDGNATYLNPGPAVYAVTGYAPEFRLATLEDGEVTLFEADTNPAAKTGADLLDIRGKVNSIDVLSTKGSIRVIGTMEEERAVERFVELVLESPVDQGHRSHSGSRYFLDFRLTDGTSVVRTFWLESGKLSWRIMTVPAVTLAVWSALSEENRPEASEQGPRISARLAVRLGLAYLRLGVPELNATDTLHSPVMRLMRRSEFQAIRGSASTMDSDPLVWVLEAESSWRTGGVVPKDKHQNLTIGLVAFDADTGVKYGTSYGDASLLGTDRPAPQVTPAPSPPPHTPEPRPSQDTVSIEEREEVKARRGTPPWGPHTAGTVIEIAGRQVQLPEDVYVEVIVDHVLCIEGEYCPATPIYGLRRGDSAVDIEKPSGQFVPGSSDADLAAFDFIQEALK